MMKQAQSDEEQQNLQHKEESIPIQRLDSNGNVDNNEGGERMPKLTPSGSPLLKKDNILVRDQSREQNDTNQQQQQRKIHFASHSQSQINSSKIIGGKQSRQEEVIPYEKYHKNGNISLKLPQFSPYSQQFPKVFSFILFIFFPFGILLAYLSSWFVKRSGTFTFINIWMMVLYFTCAFVQQIILQKNGLGKYILSKSELDYWNEPKFVKIMWGIRIGLLVLNLSLSIYYGLSVWDNVISDSIISLFIFLAIIYVINMTCVLIIFLFIIPVTNKQMITIEERVTKFKRLEKNIPMPLLFQFMNSLLEVQMHGSDGHIYQSIVASQNYQKFILEFEERQRELLTIARSRNDKLTHDASEFVNQLTKKLKDKKERQINISRVSNPGLSPFSLLVSYLSFFFTYIIAYPTLIYFALLYQDIDRNLLPLSFFGFPLAVWIWKKFTLSFFRLRQFFDYCYEARFVIFGVTAYRIGAMSVQSLDSTNFITLLLIKYTCKAIGFWIEVYGYQELLEQKKQLYMSFIRGSIVDQSQRKNQLLNRPTLDLQKQSTLKTRRQSTYEANSNEVPSFVKTAANWSNVEIIDNIKKSLVTKQMYSFIILQTCEFIFALLFLIMSSILYTESEENQRWDSFNKTQSSFTTFQTQIGVEIVFEFIFSLISLILYRSVKMPSNYSFFTQITEIIGIDGLKSLIYDYCFAVVVCFLVVGNKFQVQ